jgi:hypothetical protein
VNDYEYSGPRIPRTPETEHRVRRRFQGTVKAVTAARYDEAVRAWALANHGSFPSKEQITREVTTELETLCLALDGWGAVDPDYVMEPEWRRELGFFD